jgi:hypothetical protein
MQQVVDMQKVNPHPFHQPKLFPFQLKTDLKSLFVFILQTVT